MAKYQRFAFSLDHQGGDPPLETQAKSLDDLCEKGVELERTILYEAAIPNIYTSRHLVGNAMVINKATPEGIKTNIICQGKPDTNIVERFKKYYCQEPEIVSYKPLKRFLE